MTMQPLDDEHYQIFRYWWDNISCTDDSGMDYLLYLKKDLKIGDSKLHDFGFKKAKEDCCWECDIDLRIWKGSEYFTWIYGDFCSNTCLSKYIENNKTSNA